MANKLVEADKAAQNSFSLLKELLNKRLQDKVDDISLINKAIGDNLKLVEQVTTRKAQKPTHRPDSFLPQPSDDLLGEFQQIISQNPLPETHQNQISAEIMEEFVFESSRPVFEVFRRQDELKALRQRCLTRTLEASSQSDKIEALSSLILADLCLQNDAMFAFLANDSPMNFGAITIEVALLDLQFPVRGLGPLRIRKGP